jgi:phosphatidylglycerol:prolipoprotein diacylglycerol transferase
MQHHSYTINNHRRYGVLSLNIFAILIGAGAALGLWQIAQNAPALEVDNRLRIGWLILLCTLLGSRLFYVLFHLDYFIQHPLLVLAVWQGGLSWLGALTGAAAGLLLAARAWGQPVTELADVMMPLLPPVIIAAWLGCWQTGCAYGALAPRGAWWAVPCRDEACNTLLRFPLQPLAAISLLLYYAWLENRFKNPLPSGSRMLLAVLGLALVMLAASFLRDEPAQQWLGMRRDFWEALLVALLCLAGLGALKFNPDKQ